MTVLGEREAGAPVKPCSEPKKRRGVKAGKKRARRKYRPPPSHWCTSMLRARGVRKERREKVIEKMNGSEPAGKISSR